MELKDLGELGGREKTAMHVEGVKKKGPWQFREQIKFARDQRNNPV